MTTDCPNLMVFRGAEFDENKGYGGKAFSLGYLGHSLKGDGYKGMLNQPRKNPGLVMLPISHLILPYSNGLVNMVFEHLPLLGESFEILPTNPQEFSQGVRIYVLPGNEHRIDEILEKYEKKAVVLE